MTVGIVLLCHAALDRAAQVARFWATAGAPVVIHLDARAKGAEATSFLTAFRDLPNVSFSRRYACEWGKFSLVQATNAASSQMLALHPELTHVFLASGSCLPLRPLSELVDYLRARPTTDFIESVAASDAPWIIDGLQTERFTMRFPFSWRRQRRLFDGYVRLQRRLGVKRRIPHGLVPHLGSQWWCLTRRTLQSILDDPRREEFDRYFRRVWIPDESYFQSLARLYAVKIESRSLTLSKFDTVGKPHMFYDDHLQLLRRSDCFVARKIWRGANKLYENFLSPQAGFERAEPQPGKIDRLFSTAVERRIYGRAGLYMQSRYPAQDHENGKTCAPYSVFHGFSDLFESFDGWLAKSVGGRVHGHLFAPERAEFAGGETSFNGALSDSAALRDHSARSFLTSLIWNTRGERQCFQFSPRDNQDCNRFIATDANAQISIISGAWAVPLFMKGDSFSAIRAEAARLQRIEIEHLSLLRMPLVKARVRIWSLAEFLVNPMQNLHSILAEINPQAPRVVSEAPRMVDLSGFGQFLQNLRNQGFAMSLVGDFPTDQEWRPRPVGYQRPYLLDGGR